MSADYRFGTGYDLHPVAQGRPLLLGGVHIPNEFDKTCATLRQMGSQAMLSQARADLGEQHWAVHNVDVTILAKRPALSPHKALIRKTVADLLELDWERVSVKSVVHSGIETVEQGRAIACQAAASLRR